MRLEFGPIKVVLGDMKGSFPFCNSLFIDDKKKVIVDPGASFEKMNAINDDYNIEMVYNSHWHLDHVTYNYLFKNAKIYFNEIEKNCFADRLEIIRWLGVAQYYGREYEIDWLKRISNRSTPPSPYSTENRIEWSLSFDRLDGTYTPGEKFDFGATEMIIIGAPGHTAGYNCLYFPKQGLVYAGDYDLSDFGPVYANTTSNIDEMIASGNLIAELDADYFVTAHQAGVVTKQEFRNRLKDYLAIIDQRTERILAELDSPLSLDELGKKGIFFKPKYQDAWNLVGELGLLSKQLERMQTQGLVEFAEGKYCRKA